MMSRAIIHVLFAASLLGVGCTRENRGASPPNPQPNNQNPYPACSTNAECSAGTVCTTIGCCPGCHSDSDCNATETCTINPTANFCSPKSMTEAPRAVDPNKAGPIAAATPPAQHCTVDSNCVSGWLCNNGVCQPTCTDSSQCGAGNTCTSGRCYANGAPTCGTSGLATCSSDSQCGANRKCLGGGCHTICAINANCPVGQLCSGGACVNGSPATAQCVFDVDCGASFKCVNATCHPTCSADSQCGANAFCKSGVCRADDRPVTG
jgi:hypothetical protein